jgi:hypothetical protein
VQAEEGARTGLFDTHPATRDRIARALAERGEGIFRLDGAATDLFRDFDALARSATFDHYRAILGPSITEEQLYPVADAVQDQAANLEGHEAFGRFFLDALGVMQPLPLPEAYPAAPPDLKAAKRGLVEARSAMLEARDGNVAALSRRGELHEKAILAEAAGTLLKAGVKIKAADFGLAAATPQEADAAGETAEAESRALSTAFDPFEAAAARRLALALGLLESDAVAARMPDGPARRDEAHALYPCAALLGGRLVRDLPPVLRAQQVVVRLVQACVQGNRQKDDVMVNACLRAGRQLHDRLEELRWKLGDSVIYPFEHAQEEISLDRFALPIVPQGDALGDVIEAGGEAIERIGTLYRRVLGRLAVTAEEVERAVGLQPLETAEQVAGESVPA